eukprot:g51369.t1
MNFVSREVEKISKRERKNVRLRALDPKLSIRSTSRTDNRFHSLARLGSGLSVENMVGSEKKQKVSDASELKRLDARKGLQEDRDGARETQIERFSSSAPS